MQNTPEEALKQQQQALLKNPKDLETQLNCGNLCLELQRFEEAAGYFRRLVRVLKNHQYCRDALCFSLESLGNQAQNQGQFVMAEACFEEALEYQPSNAIYWYNMGNAQREQGKVQAAQRSFTQSIKFNPNDADAHNNLGNIQRELGQLDKAITSYKTALQLNPNLHHALAHLVHQKQHICDWDNLEVEIAEIRRLVREVPSAQISPFAFLAMPGSTPAEQKQCASNYANNTFKSLLALREQLAFKRLRTNKSKLNIGYLSADFRLHPLAFLITELIENHDRSRFSVSAYSYGALDDSATRKRLVKAFDHFHDIRALNDAQAAQKMQADGIDILVDLTGYTQSSRTGIVALKPASIHINWLGFAGTMGELRDRPLFDYIIADETIAPNQTDFSEKLLYLPCYQPNNRERPVGKSGTKAENNLPENAFVFCCFNQTFKITAEIFSVWLNILKKCPNSVLWLLECNQWAKTNLKAACEAAGVDKNRLIFAPRVAIDQHLARHAHADLFLDTLPYNAHTTASDALLMDVPVLTCMGETFASRVAASLLARADLSALITPTLEAYLAKAIALAQTPQETALLKQRLNAQIADSALFDVAQFARDLEQQYLTVYMNYIE